MNDERLNGETQRQAAEWVRGLPEEAPSLLWRSNLNEAVRAEAASRARKRRRWLVASPALGLATAAALAFVVFLPRAAPPATPTAGRLEAGLVSLYEDSVRTDDIVGAGLRPSEAVASRAPEYDLFDDLDAGAL